jgi:hypothetical protein
MRATGGFWSKIFDVQGRNFTTLTCAQCRYREQHSRKRVRLLYELSAKNASFPVGQAQELHRGIVRGRISAPGAQDPAIIEEEKWLNEPPAMQS